MSEMRVLESEIGNVVPLVDIADAIGYSRSALSKIYKSNEDLLRLLKFSDLYKQTKESSNSPVLTGRVWTYS